MIPQVRKCHAKCHEEHGNQLKLKNLLKFETPSPVSLQQPTIQNFFKNFGAVDQRASKGGQAD